MLEKISAISRQACFTAIAVATLAVGAQSAFADITIEFSQNPDNPNMTNVVMNFDMNGLATTGQQTNAGAFTNDALPVVSSSKDNNRARSLVMRGNPEGSQKVVYLETGGKVTNVEIFHKDLYVPGKPDVGTGFSWVVGDGFFAIDQTEVDKKKSVYTFFIKAPLAGVIHPDALGKTITNGKVTIKSTK